jgi:XisI protein
MGEELVKQGIPKHDIVIGFQPHHVRVDMDGYAAVGRSVPSCCNQTRPFAFTSK